jgi:hypothetical protein
MALKSIYRNDGLAQIDRHLTTPERADDLVAAVRDKWVFLRNHGYAGDYPIEIMRSPKPETNGQAKVEVVELFRWRSDLHRADAEADPAYRRVSDHISSLTVETTDRKRYTQAVRGFSESFPEIGGVELLRGVCSCLLTVDEQVEEFPLSVKNGVVLMHRSPGMDFDGDGKREMLLKILMHGGELEIKDFGPIRVEQNFDRPNDGIVKSHGTGSDFPATAIWRVHWRIQTRFGPLVTDPDKALIFGPSVALHYPPVGTEFFASSGPVDLIHEASGNVIGKLEPKRLTAFDIVVTRDDETYADILNTPPDDLLPILNAKIDEVGEPVLYEEAVEDLDEARR